MDLKTNCQPVSTSQTQITKSKYQIVNNHSTVIRQINPRKQNAQLLTKFIIRKLKSQNHLNMKLPLQSIQYSSAKTLKRQGISDN